MELNKRFSGQAFQADDPLLCARVCFRKGNNKLIDIDNFFLEFLTPVCRQRAGKPQLDATVIERVKLLIRIQLIQLQFHIRKLAPVGLHERG